MANGVYGKAIVTLTIVDCMQLS